MFRRELKSLEDLSKGAADFAETLLPGSVVCLTGDLGTGKTTFVRAVLSLWGVPPPIPSPTYSLLYEYQTSRGLVWHIDAYRLTPTTPLPWSWADANDAICFVEWGEQISLPTHARYLRFRVEGELRILEEADRTEV